MAGGDEGAFAVCLFEVLIDHHLHKCPEIDLRAPAEDCAGLGGVAAEVMNLGRAEVTLINFDHSGPIDAEAGGGDVEELADGAGFTGGDDKVAGF